MTLTTEINNIFDSVRSGLGISESDSAFDSDLINGINAALATLGQVGVGVAGFTVSEDKDELWADFIPDDDVLTSFARQYTILRVKVMFDPSASGVVAQSRDAVVAEMLGRAQAEVESKETT